MAFVAHRSNDKNTDELIALTAKRWTEKRSLISQFLARWEFRESHKRFGTDAKQDKHLNRIMT
jgi:hypothetical protein